LITTRDRDQSPIDNQVQRVTSTCGRNSLWLAGDGWSGRQQVGDAVLALQLQI